MGRFHPTQPLEASAFRAAFSANDLAFLRERAELYGAGLATTEKDWMRLPPDARAEVTPWPVRAVFEDEAALEAMLSAALGALHPA